jgi:hypothetical protein
MLLADMSAICWQHDEYIAVGFEPMSMLLLLDSPATKIVWTKNKLKFTQPVLMQSYNDKFELPKKSYRTPAPVGSVLVAGKKEESLSPAMQKKYCS